MDSDVATSALQTLMYQCKRKVEGEEAFAKEVGHKNLEEEDEMEVVRGQGEEATV